MKINLKSTKRSVAGLNLNTLIQESIFHVVVSYEIFRKYGFSFINYINKCESAKRDFIIVTNYEEGSKLMYTISLVGHDRLVCVFENDKKLEAAIKKSESYRT